MEPLGTVFYLIPKNKDAENIVDHPPNSNRTWPDPDHPSVPWLRIGLDQPHHNPPQIARFGRLSHNDVILPGTDFSRTDQCYFSFNKDSGELLLRDISEEGSTHLYLLPLSGKKDQDTCLLTELEKQPRQCVVLLGPDFCGKKQQYKFRIRKAEFWLIPPTADTTVDDQVSQVIAKLEFANGDHVEQTVDGTLERIVAAAMRIESLKGNTASYQSSLAESRKLHNTRFRTLLESDKDAAGIKTTRIGLLGSGGQGEVHRVVDKYNGNHLACKSIALATAKTLGMSARDFRTKVELEVKLVQNLRHAHIVPYIHCQGFQKEVIELFMPIYDGSLHELARLRRSPDDTHAIAHLTDSMLAQILDALNFVHTRSPPIIHRDIKPANILYKDILDEQGAGFVNKFLLADFGLAKVQDSSNTNVGTPVYEAPEVKKGNEQTTKIDLYSLGVTVVDCFINVIHFKDFFPEADVCTGELQKIMVDCAPQYTSMLETDPNRRLSAQQLRQLVPTIQPFQPFQPTQRVVQSVPVHPAPPAQPPKPTSPNQLPEQRVMPGGHRRSGSGTSRAGGLQPVSPEAGPSRPSGVSKGKHRASSRNIYTPQELEDRYVVKDA